MDQKGPPKIGLCRLLGLFKAILPQTTSMSMLLWKQIFPYQAELTQVANMGYIKVKFDNLLFCHPSSVDCGNSITVIRLPPEP